MSDPTPALTILEPAVGQRVAGAAVRVVVSAVGTVEYLRAACPEQLARPVDFTPADGGLYEVSLPLVAPPGHKTLRVTAVIGEQVLTADTEIEHTGPTTPPADPAPDPGADGDHSQGGGDR